MQPKFKARFVEERALNEDNVSVTTSFMKAQTRISDNDMRELDVREVPSVRDQI